MKNSPLHSDSTPPLDLVDLLRDLGKLEPSQREEKLQELVEHGKLTAEDQSKLRGLLDTKDKEKGDTDRPQHRSRDYKRDFITFDDVPLEFKNRIGSGGQGLVHVHPRKPDQVVKLLTAHNPNPVSLKRFRQEFEILEDLCDPNIVRVFDAGEVSSPSNRAVLYFTMEKLPGSDLTKYRDLSLEEILSIGEHVASALIVLHRRGILHRDIKDSNVIYDRASKLVKIVDFGVARVAASELTNDGPPPETALYAPKDEPVKTERSDIYSLGKMLESLCQRNSQKSNRLDRIITKCTETNPADRFATALELAATLRAVREPAFATLLVAPAALPAAEPRLPSPDRRPPPAPVQSRYMLIVCVVSVVLVGLTGWLYLSRAALQTQQRQQNLNVAEAIEKLLKAGAPVEVAASLRQSARGLVDLQLSRGLDAATDDEAQTYLRLLKQIGDSQRRALEYEGAESTFVDLQKTLVARKRLTPELSVLLAETQHELGDLRHRCTGDSQASSESYGECLRSWAELLHLKVNWPDPGKGNKLLQADVEQLLAPLQSMNADVQHLAGIARCYGYYGDLFADYPIDVAARENARLCYDMSLKLRKGIEGRLRRDFENADAATKGQQQHSWLKARHQLCRGEENNWYFEWRFEITQRAAGDLTPLHNLIQERVTLVEDIETYMEAPSAATEQRAEAADLLREVRGDLLALYTSLDGGLVVAQRDAKLPPVECDKGIEQARGHLRNLWESDTNLRLARIRLDWLEAMSKLPPERISQLKAAINELHEHFGLPDYTAAPLQKIESDANDVSSGVCRLWAGLHFDLAVVDPNSDGRASVKKFLRARRSQPYSLTEFLK